VDESVESIDSRFMGFLGGEFFVEKYPELVSLINQINNIPWPKVTGYAKWPCHTPILNGAIELVGIRNDWKPQPLVDISEKPEIGWKGDLSKEMSDGLRVFIEIELGHSKSNFQNLSKFELASMMGNYDFFLLGVPGPKLNEGIYYASDYQHFVEKKEFFKQFIHAPCVIFEIEPSESIDIPEATGLEVNKDNFPSNRQTKWGKEFIRRFNLEERMNIPPEQEEE
jgi:hypothetical protein